MTQYGSMPKALVKRLGQDRVRELSGLPPKITDMSEYMRKYRERKAAES